MEPLSFANSWARQRAHTLLWHARKTNDGATIDLETGLPVDGSYEVRGLAAGLQIIGDTHAEENVSAVQSWIAALPFERGVRWVQSWQDDEGVTYCEVAWPKEFDG